MAFLTMTYSFANSTTADASQVNTNFQDVIDATSDGTLDFNIAALTAAGASVLNGNVTLGSASSKDLTVNASLASSIPIKTTRTYDIGSADLGTRLIYLGGNSTHTASFGAPSSGFTADTNFLVPPTNGTAYYRLKTDGSGNTSWVPPAPESAAGSDADTTLTVSSARTQIVVPTADRVYTLPTTSVLAGDIFTIFNNAAVASGFEIIVKSSDADVVVTCYPQCSVQVMALQATPTDTTHWAGLTHIRTSRVAYTATAANFGTITNQSSFWNRDGQYLEGTVFFEAGTVTGSDARVSLPSIAGTQCTIDSAAVQGNGKNFLGMGAAASTSLAGCWGDGQGIVVAADSTDYTFVYLGKQNGTTAGSVAFTMQAASAVVATGGQIGISFRVPISGWTSTKG
jgi:hypothetical protein